MPCSPERRDRAARARLRFVYNRDVSSARQRRIRGKRHIRVSLGSALRRAARRGFRLRLGAGGANTGGCSTRGRAISCRRGRWRRARRGTEVWQEPVCRDRRAPLARRGRDDGRGAEMDRAGASRGHAAGRARARPGRRRERSLRAAQPRYFSVQHGARRPAAGARGAHVSHGHAAVRAHGSEQFPGQPEHAGGARQ